MSGLLRRGGRFILRNDGWWWETPYFPGGTSIDHGPFESNEEAIEYARRCEARIENAGSLRYGCCGEPVNPADMCRCDANDWG